MEKFGLASGWFLQGFFLAPDVPWKDLQAPVTCVLSTITSGKMC
jgi:hypothetical protein